VEVLNAIHEEDLDSAVRLGADISLVCTIFIQIDVRVDVDQISFKRQNSLFGTAREATVTCGQNERPVVLDREGE
jgi:hypothetical protein